MKKHRIIITLVAALTATNVFSNVMLQGFYWDSFVDTQWSNLEKQADELSQYFSLIWVPQSGNCNSDYNQMGYTPVYYFNHDSSFGTEQQLRSMINAFKAKGTGIIADVVINHRNNLGVGGSWVDYPTETYNGNTYTMYSTDICNNDDGGNTLKWAKSNGYSLSNNMDSGEDWNGCRDLDQHSSNVNTILKVYLSYLLNDLGYHGFRYDMVKGYSASFTKEYNNAVSPKFSVGEYWDGTSKIKNWIKATDYTSSAFDFQFLFRVHDAANGNNWSKLSASSEGDDGKPLIYDEYLKPYAVTFVENHDTEYRSSSAPQYPLKKDTLAANAFLLVMPGTPCVFLKHWQDYKQDIKAMIDARHTAGITATSKHSQITTQPYFYAVQVNGDNGKMIAVIGPGVNAYKPSATDFTEILSGYHYKYYLSNSTNTAWIDKASGDYASGFTVNLKAVTDIPSAKLVYQLDDGDWAEAPSTLTITQGCTLRLALSIDGGRIGLVERRYTITPFQPHTATIYVRNENTWNTTNFYLWDKDGRELDGSWPGRTITATKEVGDHTWHYQTVNITSKDYYVNAVFSTGSGTPQTVDVMNITEDSYFVIKTSQTGAKYKVEKVEAPTGIKVIENGQLTIDNGPVYNLQGQRVKSQLSIINSQLSISNGHRGVYIRNGKKYLHY